MGFSFTDDPPQPSLAAPPVKFPIKNLLPGTEIQFPSRHRDHDFPSHNLPFQMGVSVVLPGSVVQILQDRLMGSQFLEPFLVILVEAGVLIVDKNRSRDM